MGDLVKLLDDKIKQRVKIKKEMDALIVAREKHIAEEMAKKASGKGGAKNAFELSVQKLLKKQILLSDTTIR